MLTVDGLLDDGWGAKFPVKGIEIEATILFCDVSAFSARTMNLTSTETLVFINNFFSWVTAEAIINSKCIIDKYIGDELMLIFSKEFGSKEPFIEAVQTARRMCENDAHSYCPHIGIASGNVTIGYVGTPIKYNCSAFGKAVTFAARCTEARPKINDDRRYSSSIVFPSNEWGNLNFDDVIPYIEFKDENGKKHKRPRSWELLDKQTVQLKNIPDIEIMALIKRSFHWPQLTAENRAKMGLKALYDHNRYWPKDKYNPEIDAPPPIQII
jgi:hypothetical protein